MARKLSTLTIMFIMQPAFTPTELNELKSIVDTLIVSQKNPEWIDSAPIIMQQHIHQNNDLAFAACIESITSNVIQPNSSIIPMGIRDICPVTTSHAQGYVASHIVNDKSDSKIH